MTVHYYPVGAVSRGADVVCKTFAPELDGVTCVCGHDLNDHRWQGYSHPCEVCSPEARQD